MQPLPEGIHFVRARSANFPASANLTVVAARGALTLFDAGGSGEDNHAATRDALAALGHDPGAVTRVCLTHAHADHSGGLSLLRAARPDLAVAVHPRARPMIASREAFFATFDFALIRARYPDDASPGRRFVDGLERYLATGPCPFEPFAPTEDLDEDRPLTVGPFTFHALLGEGHAPGHVMFHEPEAGLLLAGDMIGPRLSWHSPSSGGVSAYLAALERAASLHLRVVLPAHGPRIDDPRPLVETLADKIRRREDKLLAWVRQAPRTFAELRSLMTGSADEHALFPSVPMLEGHLQRLEDRGFIRRDAPTQAALQRIEAVP